MAFGTVKEKVYAAYVRLTTSLETRVLPGGRGFFFFSLSQ
jgi:hypothetical protein